MADTPTTPKIDLQRVLTKVQADPTGALLVQTAVQECVIEDQATQIRQLRAELARASTDGGVPAEQAAAAAG